MAERDGRSQMGSRPAMRSSRWTWNRGRAWARHRLMSVSCAIRPDGRWRVNGLGCGTGHVQHDVGGYVPGQVFAGQPHWLVVPGGVEAELVGEVRVSGKAAFSWGDDVDGGEVVAAAQVDDLVVGAPVHPGCVGYRAQAKW